MISRAVVSPDTNTIIHMIMDRAFTITRVFDTPITKKQPLSLDRLIFFCQIFCFNI